MKSGFIPIRLEDYVEKHLHSNPGTDRADLVWRLQDAINAYRKDIRCKCGEPIWIIGSAEAGRGCFSCITSEAIPNNDYEIQVDDLEN
jgi:hypothetical protein